VQLRQPVLGRKLDGALGVLRQQQSLGNHLRRGRPHRGNIGCTVRVPLIDVLVNCAGIAGHRPFEASDPAFFHAIFDTNVLGTVAVIQAALPHLTAPGGRIINFSSGLATRPIPTTAIYAASKAAVAALSRALAKEFGPRGITVNTIAPGVIETEMTTGILAERGDGILAMPPLGRIGQSGDIAGIALFLASPDAGWVTGRTIIADGGMS
jgi:3-oxoacyl-[acyl-carrier protein] reductase